MHFKFLAFTGYCVNLIKFIIVLPSGFSRTSSRLDLQIFGASDYLCKSRCIIGIKRATKNSARRLKAYSFSATYLVLSLVGLPPDLWFTSSTRYFDIFIISVTARAIEISSDQSLKSIRRIRFLSLQ